MVFFKKNKMCSYVLQGPSCSEGEAGRLGEDNVLAFVSECTYTDIIAIINTADRMCPIYNLR